jgi:hypothetical protein
MAFTVTFLGHDRTHVTQTLVARHTTAEQEFGLSCMSHGAFSNFHASSKSVLLQ